jgi:RNA recognition motif. (a.k.a. RRM, RBD, or RNP domain)
VRIFKISIRDSGRQHSKEFTNTLLLADAYRFAYIEFSNKESVDNALKLDDTLFKGRQLKVMAKRT